jgi:hypothetical protein
MSEIAALKTLSRVLSDFLYFIFIFPGVFSAAAIFYNVPFSLFLSYDAGKTEISR